jgi:hypothetical protein
MSATTLPSAPEPSSPARGASRAVAIVAGVLLALIAAALLTIGAIGLWADSTQRDADGGLASPWHHFDTPTRALTAEGLQLGDLRGGPDAWVEDLGAIRVRARRSDGGPVFVGLAPEARADAYLAGVAHTEVDEVRPVGYRGTVRPGARVPGRPGAAGWSASDAGPGTRTARWDPEAGKWAIVVMNADASPGVSVDVQIGARAGWLLPVTIAFLIAGGLFAAGAAALIAYRAGGSSAAPAPETDEEDAQQADPVAVSARLDEPLSRWLWLVKWLLALPHYVILAFLWPAFIVVTAIAMIAIVATGRYPRALFNFNVGVLRWTWRVGFHAYSGLATDRYPP